MTSRAVAVLLLISFGILKYNSPGRYHLHWVTTVVDITQTVVQRSLIGQCERDSCLCPIESMKIMTFI